MSTAARFAAGVRRAVEDQPYSVLDETPEGFSVHIDVVDARWWSLLSRHGLEETWRWDVRVRADDTYSVTDRPGEVQWQVGVDGSGGVPRPTLRFRASAFRGTAVDVRTETTWGFDDEGRFTRVVDYSFDSREGRDLIDAVAERLGLRKTMNTWARIGLYVGLGTLVLLAIGALVVLGLLVTGNLV